MPDFVDNTAGYSEVTGTSDYAMTTTSTGRHRRLDQALTNGQQVAYYAIGTSNGVDAFESGIGTWQSSGTALVRGTVTNSTNGGTISWDAGTKTVYIVANAATLVNTADERLDSTGIDELDPGTTPDGTEIAHFLQDGDGVSLTAAQIQGDPVRQRRGHGLNYLRGYSNFSKTLPTFSGTNGAICGLEPYISYFSGTGASVVQFAGFLYVNSLGLLTGTTTTGYAAIQHLEYPNTFDPNKHWECIFQGGFNGVLPNVEASTAQIGFTGAAVTALATGGMYFEATEASPNWWAVVRANPANVTKKDTGVAYTNDTDIRFKVVFDPTPDPKETRFYINETLVATTIPSERIVALFTLLQMTAQIRKTAGTTAAGMAFTDHSYAIETAELVGF